MLKEHTDFEKKQWSSHQEVIIDYVMKHNKIDTMLEIGMGIYSTPVYAPLVSRFISFETNKEWYDFMIEKYPDLPNHSHSFVNDYDMPKIVQAMADNGDLPDLVLVDHAHPNVLNQRAMVANLLMQLKCKFIIIHDVNEEMKATLDNSSDYDFYINSKSINPSILMVRK